MSREEALKKVKGYLISYLPSDMSDEIEDICSALEQEPLEVEAANLQKVYNKGFEDCRQAVLDLPRIKTHNVWGNVINESVDVENVRQLPSVTPQPCEDYPNKWIPVSERLPEEAGMYLCSYDDDDVGSSYFDISMNEFNMLHEQVTAWMYIPEPYKQEVEE